MGLLPLETPATLVLQDHHSSVTPYSSLPRRGTNDFAQDVSEKLKTTCKRLGGGAAGDVFEGWLQERRVAVKIIRGPVCGKRAERKIHEQWMREKRTALMLAKSPHRNLLKYFAVYESQESNGIQNSQDGIIVMEPGHPVDPPITEPRDDPLSPVVYRTFDKRARAIMRTASIAVSLVNALSHLHAVGKSIHRDVKPDNVLRTEDGRICLCDFSAARTQMYSLQRATTYQGIGTQGFLAPEMYARGTPYCAKVDTWALGCTLLAYYNCGRPYSGGEFYGLTNALQFDEKNEERIARERSRLDDIVSTMLIEALPDDDRIGGALRRLLRMCLYTDPAMRPSIVSLASTEELQILAEACNEPLDAPPAMCPASLSDAEPADVVSALIHNLIERFDITQTGRLETWELDLVRDRLHRSLEENDTRSRELLGCWLDFQMRCPEAKLDAADEASGSTLLHCIARNHRSEELLALLEDFCAQISPSLPECPLALFMKTRNREGQTPLWVAASMSRSVLFVVRLIELGADIHEVDDAGTPVFHACLAPGYQRIGEQRVDVATALRGFGGEMPKDVLEKQGPFLSRLLKVAILPIEEARKKVSMWHEHLQEQRRKRDIVRMGEMISSIALPSLVLNDSQSDRLASEEKSALTHEPNENKVRLEKTIEELQSEMLNPESMISECSVAEQEEIENAIEYDSLNTPAHVEAAASNAENKLRRHLLQLSKGHVQSAFRVADFDCDNHVGASDVHHWLDQLQIAEDDQARGHIMRYFSRGVCIKGFSRWLRGLSNASDIESQPCATLRPSAKKRSSSRASSRQGNVLPAFHAIRVRASDNNTTVENCRDVRICHARVVRPKKRAPQNSELSSPTSRVSALPFLPEKGERSRSPATITRTPTNKKTGSHTFGENVSVNCASVRKRSGSFAGFNGSALESRSHDRPQSPLSSDLQVQA